MSNQKHERNILCLEQSETGINHTSQTKSHAKGKSKGYAEAVKKRVIVFVNRELPSALRRRRGRQKMG